MCRNSLILSSYICAFTFFFSSLHLLMFKFDQPLTSGGGCPNRSDFFRQTTHHLLPCCCFRAWHCGITFHVPPLPRWPATDIVKALWPGMNQQPISHNQRSSCCFCYCYYYEEHGSTARPVSLMNTFSPISGNARGFCWESDFEGSRWECFASERHTAAKRAGVCFSQDNYYFSGTELKQACISHS